MRMRHSSFSADLDEEDAGDENMQPFISLSISQQRPSALRAPSSRKLASSRLCGRTFRWVVIETGDGSVNDEIEKVLKACVLGATIETVARIISITAVPSSVAAARLRFLNGAA